MSFLDDFDPDEERMNIMEAQADRERERELDARLECCKCKVCGTQYESDKWLARHMAKHHGLGNDMEQAKPKSQDKVTSKPPKHSCTAEIIAELERLLDEINVFQEHAPEPNETLKRINKAIFKRLNHYKAKETQL